MRELVHEESRVLSNGMRVVLIHKPDYVKSLFMIGVPAGGSTVEIESENGNVVYPKGCAHFLEHQMFRFQGEDVTRLLSENRAQTNAFTTYDETCYYVQTYGDWKSPLSILIDFVQTLDIDNESVDREKGIILSEYQQYELLPEMRILKEIYKSLYHVNPVRDDILGTVESISDMTPEHLRAFYNMAYNPRGLVLVGVTGAPLEEIFEFIEEKEKSYPAKDEPDPVVHYLEEPETVARESVQVEMDVDLSYGALAVKLKPVPDIKQAIRQDYMLNLWLLSQFSTVNPRFEDWLARQVVTGPLAAEADLDAHHGYIMIAAQSENPELFLKEVKEVLEKKEPVEPEVFESLLIRYKAGSLRLYDQFENLASETIRGLFAGYRPQDDLQILDGITNQDVTDFIQSLDFSNISTVTLIPSNEDTVAG
jgi:predicted Zn-dependent peptidase